MTQRYAMILVACFTLGLAPFVPAPHLWGKLRWLAGGGHGMQSADFFDLLMHGAPWLVLLAMGGYDGMRWLLRRRRR